MMEMAYDQRELSSEEEAVAGGDLLRRGPWTVEEDLLLVNYIAAHGEGRWNALARCAGLKRTGKSCRLRWLNYLRPDLRRGNITAREQLLILELHARWGNRWSKIAQHLPGRTDNEIKNYWRTRVQKHARQLCCDVGSQRFKDLVRYLWMPRLLERVHSSAAGDGDGDGASIPPSSAALPVSSSADEFWPVDVSLSPGAAAEVELSCTTAVSPSTSVSLSTDGGMQLVSPPAPPLMAAAESALACYDGPYNTAAAAMREYDTACQPPQTHGAGLMAQHQQQPDQSQSQFGGETCWSESLASGLYGDIGLPDLEVAGGETMMWGACGDDLWYTHMLGL